MFLILSYVGMVTVGMVCDAKCISVKKCLKNTAVLRFSFRDNADVIQEGWSQCAMIGYKGKTYSPRQRKATANFL